MKHFTNKHVQDYLLTVAVAVMAAVCFVFVNGCSKKEAPYPHFLPGPGIAVTSWSYSGSCDERPCFRTIEVVYDYHGATPPLMSVTGEYVAAFEISGKEQQEIFEAGEDIVGLHPGPGGFIHREPDQCVTGTHPEIVYSFAGDAGFSGEIQGCNAPEVTHFRTLMRSVALKHLPVNQ